jgi:hypothetical protein
MMPYGAEMRGREGGWEMVDRVQWRFYKKAFRLPSNATNGAADSEFGTDSMRGKILCAATKYWVRVKQRAKENL